MKDIAPHITRQRLIIEATYDRDVDADAIKTFLLGLARHLGLRTYGEPIVHAPSDGKEKNQGFDAFVPLIDSGISLYVWTNERFLSCVLYTCKAFSEARALAYVSDYFRVGEIEHTSF